MFIYSNPHALDSTVQEDNNSWSAIFSDFKRKKKKIYFKDKINVKFKDSKSLEKFIVGQPITA